MTKKRSTGFVLLVIGFLLSMQFTFFRMAGLINRDISPPVLYTGLEIASVVGVLLGLFGLAIILSARKKKEEDAPSE